MQLYTRIYTGTRYLRVALAFSLNGTVCASIFKGLISNQILTSAIVIIHIKGVAIPTATIITTISVGTDLLTARGAFTTFINI